MKGKTLSHRTLILILAAVLLFGMLGACAPESPSEPSAADTPGSETEDPHWVLTATLHVTGTHVCTVFLEEYARRVLEATDGQVEIQVFPGAILAGAGAALEAVVNNTVDIAWCFTSFFPGQFPLTDVVAQPLIGVKNAPQVTSALWDLWEKYDEMDKELETGYKVLQLYSNPPNSLFFADKRVDSIEMLSGLSLRAPSGPITDILARWGATPVFIGPPDTYESLQKGIVDGCSFEYSGFTDYKLEELTKYYMDMNIYCGPFLVIMNKDIWEGLPKDIQDKIDSVSGRDCSVEQAELFQEDYDAKKEKTLSVPGRELVEVSPEEYAKFEAVAMEYNAEWVAQNSTDTFDAQQFLDDAMAFLAKYE